MPFVLVASGWGRINEDGELFGKAEVVDLSPNGLLRGVREAVLDSPDPELFVSPKLAKGKKDEGFLSLPHGIYSARFEIVERYSKKEQMFKNICYVHELRKCSLTLEQFYEFLSNQTESLKNASKTSSSGFQVST